MIAMTGLILPRHMAGDTVRYCHACHVAWAVAAPIECWVCGQRGSLHTLASWRNPARWRP